MGEAGERLKLLEAEIERRLVERFAALRDEFDRLRVESDRRWAGFLERFEQKFTGIVPAELVMAPAASQAQLETTAVRGSLSVDVARRLDEAGSQIEILNRFLDLSRRHASRVALLVLKGGSLGVWKTMGFSDHGGSDDNARAATLSMGGGSPLAGVLEGDGFSLESGNRVSADLGAKNAARAILVPMVVKEKISGALYADCAPGEEDAFDPDALALLTFVAGLAVDRLAARKLLPAPSLRPFKTGPAIAAEPALEFEVEEEPPAPRPSAEAARFKTQMMPAVDASPAIPKPPPISLSGSPSLSPSSDLAASEPPEAASSWPGLDESSPRGSGPRPAPDALSASPTAGEKPGATITPMPPPAARISSGASRPSIGARRLAGPLAPAEADERRDEARRFAKLLVSEIKLYNEKLVQQGRQHGNLYELLKEDIDRSRQMYDERIPEDVRASSNFFYEEMVRVLADGKAETLGL